MAGTQGIEIVISGKDRFSPAFSKLDESFQAVGRSGERMGEALSGMDARFQAFDQNRAASREELAGELERIELDLGGRLMAVDEETASRRNDLREQEQSDVLAAAAAHHTALENQERASQEASLQILRMGLNERLELARTVFGSLAALAETRGKSMASVAKSLAVAEAVISTYLAANKALAQVPYPFNLAAVAAVVAQGMANVYRIQQVNTAHGGLENVPDDATYLLKRGERVLTPAQNRGLSRFLQNGGGDSGGGLVVQNLVIHVLENATNAEALLKMSPAELRQVIADKFIPALDDLARMGIKPGFSTRTL